MPRFAYDAGFAVSELHTSWFKNPPEEAVIEARAEQSHEATRSEEPNDAVVKVLGALCANGYEPVLRIEDIEYHDGGPLPAWTPEEPKQTGFRPDDAFLRLPRPRSPGIRCPAPPG